MKKFTIVVVALLFIQITASSQSCLPEGIIFATQAEIDSFQINYPNCTEIEGDVWIQGYDITNLIGLSVLNSIGGDLSILLNHALTSLTELDNITSIGGGLLIDYNNALTSLTGLDNVTTIGGNLEIRWNDALTSLSGLDNIDAGSIDDLYIYDNISLAICEVESICNYLANPNGTVIIHSNASGCNNPPEVANGCGITLSCLPYGNYYFFTQYEIDDFQANYTGCTEIEGDVIISGFDITNLNGLSVLNSIGGDLEISHSDSLTSLTGLDNVISIGGGLGIMSNDTLENLSGLDYLTSIGGNVWISNNDALISLSGLNNLTSIEGKLYIMHNPQLTNLSGFNNLTSIGEDIWIYETNNLTNLIGLDNLSSIGGSLKIENNYNFASLEGLVYLTSIGEDIWITNNDNLISLYGLWYVTSVGGNLVINFNDALKNLTGLDNIEAASIDNLYILNNSCLTSCQVQSVCDYLASPNGVIEIFDNATGCNSQEEVEEACESISVESLDAKERLVIYPNPLLSTTAIEYKLKEPAMVSLIIYNHLGQQIETLVNQQLSQGKHQVTWDAEDLPSGIYFFRLQAGVQSAIGKMMVVR